MLASLFLILRVQLLFHALDEGVKKAEEHDEEAHVGEVTLAVRTREDVFEK